MVHIGYFMGVQMTSIPNQNDHLIVKTSNFENAKVLCKDDIIFIKWVKHPEVGELNYLVEVLNSIKKKYPHGAAIINIIDVHEAFPPKSIVLDKIKEMSKLNYCTAHVIKSRGFAGKIARSFIKLAVSLSKVKRNVEFFEDESDAIEWFQKNTHCKYMVERVKSTYLSWVNS